MDTLSIADWDVAEWIGGGDGFSTADLSGRVVVAAAFQMLCPGCVERTIPQLRTAAALFRSDEVAVVGLHTVFEHHEAMTPVALRAFLHEYRVGFPVAVDSPAPDGGRIPVTMGRFALQGTPTVMLHDRAGRLRQQRFGHVTDMQLGAEVVRLLGDEATVTAPAGAVAGSPGTDCDEGGCRPPAPA